MIVHPSGVSQQDIFRRIALIKFQGWEVCRLPVEQPMKFEA